MKTERVRDILHHTKELHNTIASYYEDLGSQADKERLKLLLNYLYVHEKHLEETFTEYEDIANITILDSWMPFSNCDENISRIRKKLNSEELSVAKLLKLAIEVDECIITMYKTLRDNSDNELLREVFNNILEMEQKEERLAIRDMGMINEF